MKMLGIKVELKEHFSVIRETLDRIGVVNREKKILNPSCYLLHKKGEYYIIHFKNLLKLDGNKTDYSEEDNIRQTSIAQLLEDWGLIEIIDTDSMTDESVFVFVLPFNKKSEYMIKHKYQIGIKHEKRNKTP